MHRIKLLPFAKLTNSIVGNNWSLNVKIYNTVNTYKLLAPSFVISSQQRTAHTKLKPASVSHWKAVVEDAYYWISDKIYYHTLRKFIYRSKGALLYRYSFDDFDYIRFMKEHKMPDTFHSWFLVTELHVWMLMVRLMAAGKDGYHMRHHLVAALWQDTDVRKKMLGGVKNSTVQDQIQLMGYHFTAAITNYDEGLLGSDAILAGAVWRRILQMNCDDPELVERVVKYIRQTLHEFDEMPHEVFLLASKIKWIDFQLPEKRIK